MLIFVDLRLAAAAVHIRLRVGRADAPGPLRPAPTLASRVHRLSGGEPLPPARRAMTTGRRTWCALMLALAVCSTPLQVRAGSFFIEESSVQASGRASAGQSAQTRDASGLFYNPANVV